MKKELNVAQRVELLLKEGVDNPKKWAAVHGYVAPEDRENKEVVSWSHEWNTLRAHHLQETNFLFDMLREMREQLLTLQQNEAELVETATNARRKNPLTEEIKVALEKSGQDLAKGLYKTVQLEGKGHRAVIKKKEECVYSGWCSACGTKHREG